MGYHNAQFNFRLDRTCIGEILKRTNSKYQWRRTKCDSSTTRRIPSTSCTQLTSKLYHVKKIWYIKIYILKAPSGQTNFRR